MSQPLLPLFPLQVVVFPRTPLPLHIFEERYKEMVGRAVREQTEFGVVLARENGIVNVGCTVSVEKTLKKYPDGRFDVLTLGRRRFKILELDEEEAWLRGTVEFFDDDAPGEAAADVRARALERYKSLWEIVDTDQLPEPALDDPQLSFQLAHIVQDLEFRQLMLQVRSEADRMRRLADFLDAYLPKQRIIAGVRRLAPTNGHSRIPPKLSDAQ